MNTAIYVVYCYYPFFGHGLPRRKWVKFYSKEDARAFVEKSVAGRRDRFLWAYVIGGIEYEEI